MRVTITHRKSKAEAIRAVDHAVGEAESICPLASHPALRFVFCWVQIMQLGVHQFHLAPQGPILAENNGV